ncbi:ATP-binding cassette domain-containing protein [Companilactobacillus ginsenosidimutans]|uniref:ABC transporter domain-containing protein n=1 Tax=Companilactobacillus ginsenosidimutans TaxID=1007676 RepID=A0A0H4QKS5_9LACO|nr:ATP-binding cassette domain-containing protein [Companilactobacillus ginsenosidimutans]AKP67318.1 hypothetical protein ABM34_07040 [Companilactobacillus ginsenosidimutans]
MKILTVKDLSFENEGYFAFKHVTFSLSQNESIEISGDSGTGKSALLETIVGLNTPDSGTAKYSSGARISFMPQIETQHVDIPVGEYLETSRQLAGKLAVDSDQLNDLSAYMGMRPYIDRKVSSLSLGLKQRVSFLQAVATRPSVLILDDPFSFQNSFYAHNMVDIFKDLQDHGSGIIVTTSKRDPINDDYFDSRYVMEAKSLEALRKNHDWYLLSFKATTDSMAITKELAGYMANSFGNIIELKVPVVQKESVIRTMLEMNYLFEGMMNLEV